MITEQQYTTCLHANGQFCKVDAPFQALTNPPTYIMALHTTNDHEIEVQCSLSILHIPPHILHDGDHIKPMDPYFNTHYIGNGHKNNMP